MWQCAICLVVTVLVTQDTWEQLSIFGGCFNSFLLISLLCDIAGNVMPEWREEGGLYSVLP